VLAQKYVGAHGRIIFTVGLKEIGCECLGWINLTYDRDKWQDVVNTVMNVWIA
jgi:hypothetical protein